MKDKKTREEMEKEIEKHKINLMKSNIKIRVVLKKLVEEAKEVE